MNQTCQVVAVADSRGLEQWQLDSIRALADNADVDSVRIVSVENQKNSSVTMSKSVLQRCRENLLEFLLGEHPSLSIVKASDYIEYQYVVLENQRELHSKIIEIEPSIVIDFSSNQISLNSEFSPKFGYWYFQFPKTNSGQTYIDIAANLFKHYFWIDAALVAQMDSREAVKVLRSGRFPLIWLARNELYTNVLERCANWPNLVLKSTLTKSVSSFSQEAQEPVEPLSNLNVLRFLGLWLSEKFKYFLKSRVATPKMNVGMISESLERLVEDPKDISVRWIPISSHKYFLADCYFRKLTDRGTILAEKFAYLSRLGKIVEIDVEQSFRENKLVDKTIIDSEYHFSYPQIFHFEDQEYCIAESCAQNKIPVYLKDNSKWQHHTDILEGHAIVDPTLVKHDSLYWIFCTLEKNPHDELFAFYAETPFSEWKPHLQNPLKLDVTSARPGGNFFWYEGELYRPAQDVGKHYGYGMAICKVLSLNVEEYREEVAFRLYADNESYYSDGYHTLSVNDEQIAIDGIRYGYGIDDLTHKGRRLFARLLGL